MDYLSHWLLTIGPVGVLLVFGFILRERVRRAKGHPVRGQADVHAAVR